MYCTCRALRLTHEPVARDRSAEHRHQSSTGGGARRLPVRRRRRDRPEQRVRLLAVPLLADHRHVAAGTLPPATPVNSFIASGFTCLQLHLNMVSLIDYHTSIISILYVCLFGYELPHSGRWAQWQRRERSAGWWPAAARSTQWADRQRWRLQRVSCPATTPPPTAGQTWRHSHFAASIQVKLIALFQWQAHCLIISRFLLFESSVQVYYMDLDYTCWHLVFCSKYDIPRNKKIFRVILCEE